MFKFDKELNVRQAKSNPVLIHAVQYDGRNGEEIAAWVKDNSAGKSTVIVGKGYLDIPTLEGTMRGGKGWWIIRGTKGEFYPCEDDVFQVKYTLL